MKMQVLPPINVTAELSRVRHLVGSYRQPPLEVNKVRLQKATIDREMAEATTQMNELQKAKDAIQEFVKQLSAIKAKIK